MADDAKKKGLGRGLSALLGEDTGFSGENTTARIQPESFRSQQVLAIDLLVPNPNQPRRHFDEEALEELTASVREKGIIQPIIVRPTSDDREFYEIVAGERRWRAAQRARLHEAPVVIKDLTDVEVLELAIIENIQRADLNALEEALGYAELIEAFHHTQEKLARIVGKSRSYIANSLRLLQLPMEVQTYLRDGRLTPGHARALITSENAAELAHIIVEKGLSVRDTERLAKSTAASSKPGHKTELKPEKDTDTLALEGDLSAALGMNVTIHHAGQKGGELRISYRTLEELDEVCRRLCTDTTYSNGDDF